MEGKELHQQLLYKSTVWPINPASSRNRSHRLLGGGEFTTKGNSAQMRGYEVTLLR
jgi:hypothetical protein